MAQIGVAHPEGFSERNFDELDPILLDQLQKDRLITPDIVRGNCKTLETTVLDQNWPTLENAKGKFLFILDDTVRKGRCTFQGSGL